MSLGETIAERLFYVTVHVTAVQPDGGTSIGTGFIYRVATSQSDGATFIVTNKHVIAGATSIRLRLHQASNETDGGVAVGEVVDVSVDPAIFTGHPDPDVDVCVLPYKLLGDLLATTDTTPFNFHISDILTSDPSDSDELDALEEIVFVGYPNGLFDSRTYLPIVRRGITASNPREDYGGNPVFLIDASVFPGSSGSPVLIFQRGAFSVRDGPTQIGSRTIFLGIVASVYRREVPVLTSSAAEPFVEDLIDIGVVYKARTIDETCGIVLAANGLSRYR